MRKFTANYAYTNHNFVIQNLEGEKVGNKFLAASCILKNILQRGKPTILSDYLQSKLGRIHERNDFNNHLPLIYSEPPVWHGTIKGDNQNNYYPARIFFEQLIPEYLPEHRFIQQLILPEAEINEITQNDISGFANQSVDFYLPQAKLVIEIDGQQHKLKETTRVKDTVRDRHLAKYGIFTVRITTADIDNKGGKFIQQIRLIIQRINSYRKILEEYNAIFNNPQLYQDPEIRRHKLLPTAVIRFQILMLELLETGRLSLDQRVWILCVLEQDIKDFVDLALEDLFIWFHNILKLQSIEFKKPHVEIKLCASNADFEFSDDVVNIDFSINRRWTDENDLQPNVIFVRTDYYDYLGGHSDYFRVSVTDPVKYNIIADESNDTANILQFFLRNIFGHPDFKEGQLRIITNALARRDTIGLLPTGAGKSLCYQLAALLQPCVSLVVCPIKALMYDQKLNLDSRYIHSTNFITGDQTAQQKAKIVNELAIGKYLWVWISPERFQTRDFRSSLERLNKEVPISYAVIDEVHCLSEWGHDFRTSYLNLAKTIRRYCPSAIFLGLTATASQNVLKDIQNEFRISKNDVKTLVEYTRPELNFHVENDKGNKLAKTTEILNGWQKKDQAFELAGPNTKCGVIFTPNVNGAVGCYDLSNILSSKMKIDVRWYSGDIPKKGPRDNKIPVMAQGDFDTYKMKLQKDYHENTFALLVATKAFGMGIDKENIRYTIHYGIPGSMESLYQEAGRAGRDGREAKCIVVFSPETVPVGTLDTLFDLNTPVEKIQGLVKNIGWNGRDAFRVLYLWLSQQETIEYDFKLIKTILEKFCLRSSQQLIVGRTIPQIRRNCEISKQALERAIYRLSLLGIVDDWIVEDWFVGNFRIYVNDYSDATVKNTLVTHLSKYDKEFDFEKEAERYTSKELLDQCILVLLEWVYNHFAYMRRQSIKNVYKLCKEFTNGVAFKCELERMFKFGEYAHQLDEIAERPKDYTKWFSIFHSNVGDRIGFVNEEQIKDIKGALTRFLESYRFNPGLNLVSGLIRFLVDDFEDTDGRRRFTSALEKIQQFDTDTRQVILSELLKIGSHFSARNKETLSELLLERFPHSELEIFQVLNDNVSLNVILQRSVQKLKTINERIYV